MTTLTLQVSNPSLLPSLKKILNALDGVTIAKPKRNSRVCELEDVPNKTTIAAIEEVKKGKTFKASSVDDLFYQCLGHNV